MSIEIENTKVAKNANWLLLSILLNELHNTIDQILIVLKSDKIEWHREDHCFTRLRDIELHDLLREWEAKTECSVA